jgi:MFS family permease
LSFALLHLAAMAVIARVVPPASAASAQSVYGALGVGAAGAALSLASGFLFSRFGAASFWVMAALATLALPIVVALPPPETSGNKNVPAETSGPATGTAVKPSTAPAAGGNPGVPGKPGSKTDKPNAGTRSDQKNINK